MLVICVYNQEWRAFNEAFRHVQLVLARGRFVGYQSWLVCRMQILGRVVQK